VKSGIVVNPVLITSRDFFSLASVSGVTIQSGHEYRLIDEVTALSK
jgi:hypothetical protein